MIVLVLDFIMFGLWSKFFWFSVCSHSYVGPDRDADVSRTSAVPPDWDEKRDQWDRIVRFYAHPWLLLTWPKPTWTTRVVVKISSQIKFVSNIVVSFPRGPVQITSCKLWKAFEVRVQLTNQETYKNQTYCTVI